MPNTPGFRTRLCDVIGRRAEVTTSIVTGPYPPTVTVRAGLITRDRFGFLVDGDRIEGGYVTAVVDLGEPVPTLPPFVAYILPTGHRVAMVFGAEMVRVSGAVVDSWVPVNALRLRGLLVGNIAVVAR